MMIALVVFVVDFCILFCFLMPKYMSLFFFVTYSVGAPEQGVLHSLVLKHFRFGDNRYYGRQRTYASNGKHSPTRT